MEIQVFLQPMLYLVFLLNQIQSQTILRILEPQEIFSTNFSFLEELNIRKEKRVPGSHRYRGLKLKTKDNIAKKIRIKKVINKSIFLFLFILDHSIKKPLLKKGISSNSLWWTRADLNR